mmetsp:Transcript_31226/g.58625  ORF Transcript_31226/g.58625 Transcript_31226/m.58625 type:complete len:678 (+) Transcript_31226:67-2100(+)
MGFLHESEPMSWEQSKAILKYVRQHGIEQFLSILKTCGATDGDPFKWGDEVEHQVFRLLTGPSGSSVRTALRSPEILAELQKKEEELQASGSEGCVWVPEFGRWMLESTPGRPYEGLAAAATAEAQLSLRRQRLRSALRPDEVAPTVTAFPLLGVGESKVQGPVLESLFLPDESIFPHPRFPTLARNIRERRGGKVEIRRPKMKDLKTLPPESAASTSVPSTVEEADALDHVYADAMPFGMGSSCLQVTMQASNLQESRKLYDQLAPLTSVLLALTAATPFLRGWICDDDVRWGQIAQSVDDRTAAERGVGASEADERLAGSGVTPLRKSRYDSVDCYIGEDSAKFNDVPMVMEEGHLQQLRAAGVDEVLARHVAHLFARDPLVMFGDRIELDDTRDIDHWENLQSTNWQSLRWKPPPPHKGQLSNENADHIGWRVEFRSMELQLTDFENAAFISFIVLLSRTLLDLNLDLRIPMSKVEENMTVAGRRSACTHELFWFRTNCTDAASEPQYERMSIYEILRGNAQFSGLLPLCRQYLATKAVEESARRTFEEYLNFIELRAAGAIPTGAQWMRNFVRSHASYQHDSRVPEAAAHDLMVAADEIGSGARAGGELLGPFASLAALTPEMRAKERKALLTAHCRYFVPKNSCHQMCTTPCLKHSEVCPLECQEVCPLMTA